MIGPRAPSPAEPADHPLRAALARGDRLFAHSLEALGHLLATEDHTLLSEAVVAQVSGLLADLAGQLIAALHDDETAPEALEQVLARLRARQAVRHHCHALALEWWLTRRCEADQALDPVLSPLLRRQAGEGEAKDATLAMAALAAQARFAQAQRRMQLPLGELPAEVFHAVLTAARSDGVVAMSPSERLLREDYDEAQTRVALLARLAAEDMARRAPAPAVEESGIALWLSVVAVRTGESRDRIAAAAADPQLGRLLLTLRAAGFSPAEAERQALWLHPTAVLPRGLHDIGTREAAQWLVDERR